MHAAALRTWNQKGKTNHPWSAH